MKRIFKVVSVVCLLGVFPFLCFAGEDTTSAEAVQDQDQKQSLYWNYNPVNVNKDNTQVGSWLHATGMSPGLPEIPLQWVLLIQQYNEATPQEIFSSMPDTITWDHIEAYRQSMKEEMSSWDQGKLKRNINGRSFTWVKDLPKSEAIKAFPGFPNSRDEMGKLIAQKDRDYMTVARLVFNSEDEIAYREDLAIEICDWAMRKGADALIVTGWGARRVFDTKAGSLSVLTAFGQIFTSGWTGAMNVSPGAGASSGASQTQTLPYLRVAALKVLNPDRFVSGMFPTKPVEKMVAPVDPRGTELLNCPAPIPANGMKRLRSANAELDKYFSSEVQEEKNLALVRARDDLVQATRDGLRGEPLKVAQLGVASVWWEMSLVTTGDKTPYVKNAITWTRKAGEEKFPQLEAYKPQLEDVVQ